MAAESKATVATMYFAQLSLLVPFLRDGSLSGIVPRYLRKVVPNGKVPFSTEASSAAFAIGGIPLRRPAAEYQWIFGENNLATSALCQFLRQSLDRPRLCFHPGIMPTIEKHFPNSWIGTGHFFVSLTSSNISLPDNCRVVTFSSREENLRFNEEISGKLPSKEIWAACGLQYAGLEIDGSIEAIVEYTVDDGEFCLLQQVYTSKNHRKRGYAKALIVSMSKSRTEKEAE